MSVATGTASSYLDLMDKLRRYAGGFGTAGSPAPGSNTGNGTVTAVDTTAASLTETFTLTCTAAAANSGTFSVVGSVSGALASATVGTPYTNAFLSFTINDGSTDFIVGDSFTIAVTQGAVAAAGDAWEVMRWTGGNELIMKGPGLDDAQEIFVGFKGEFSTPSDYFNWDCRGFTGFNAGNTFSGQSGASPAKYLSLWDSSIAYWFIVNGQRIIIVAKVSTTYHLGYFGYILPYGQPSAFPYPMLIAASIGTAATRWSSTNRAHSNLTNPDYSSPEDGVTNSADFYDVGGTWQPLACVNAVTPNALWPWCYQGNNGLLSTIDVNPDGTYTLLPAVLMQQQPGNNLLGEIDGIYWTTGQSLGAEDIITNDGDDYLVVPNIFRSTRSDYCAVKLA